METIIRTTRSLCPVCLTNLPARMVRQPDGQIHLKKECPDHGSFSVPVWHGTVDFEQWTRCVQPMDECSGLFCPQNCGLCDQHESDTCCILLEVTKRCNLCCSFCFANGGSAEEDPPLSKLKTSVEDIVRQCRQPLLQLSGGEPTLRDDLPELIRYAKEAGCSYVQLNTNGLRLAQEPDYAAALAQAGLDIVFLQFDGLRDEIYETLRGRPLLHLKQKAIEVCSGLRIGVTLVPTVVPGINDSDLGDLIAYAAGMVPAVRAVHFQPVAYFGRFPNAPEYDGRYTLDQLMTDISDQTGIPVESFMPSRCDHPLCGFHANFMVNSDGSLKPLTSITNSTQNRSCAKDNREYVARHWRRAPEPEVSPTFSDEMDFDTFLYRLHHGSLAISSMAFQDAGSLNIERLRQCSLHVYSNGKTIPFCANYLSSFSVDR